MDNQNQNPVNQQTQNAQTPESVVNPNISPSANPTPNSKSHKKTLIALVVALVIVIVGGSVFAFYHSKHHTKTNATATITNTASTTKTSTPPLVTNTWTGKDNNYNWNEANNWSLGIPTNNQILEINVANIVLPANDANFNFQNDISNLTINKLVIDGQSSKTVGFDITGNPLTVTSGIDDTATATNAISYSTEIQINIQVNIVGNAAIVTNGHNMLTFYSSDSGEEINLGKSSLQFTVSDSSQIDISGAIVGTGDILFANNGISSKGLVMFETSSPNFNGKVVIGSGDSVSVGNQDNNGGYGSVDAFGTSSVDIMSDGTMVVFAAGTSSFSINNPISVSGNGITQSNGSVTGAISGCVTSAEEGCGANENITFTGQVKLLGNTQIGQSTPSSLGANNTHVSYTFNNIDKNGYSLNTVTDYFYNAEF